VKLITTAALLLMASSPTLAQEVEHPYRGQGYAFFGLGTATPGSPFLKYVGGGGDAFLYEGFAFGGEAECAQIGQYNAFNALIGSADFSYHFGRHAAPGKVDPFVLAGFSVVGPSQKGNGRGSPAGNFGGGANVWLVRHAALRFEFRDVVGANFWPYDHAFSFRVGMTFR
jgi:hypothetical protein